MLIAKGQLVHPVNAARQADLHTLLDFDRDAEAQHYVLFQLYEEDGKPVQYDYSGRGRIATRNDGSQWFVMGNPGPSDIMHAYRVANDPTAESSRALDQFVAGMKHAWKGGRIRAATDEWKAGWKAGRSLRAKYPNEARASR